MKRKTKWITAFLLTIGLLLNVSCPVAAEGNSVLTIDDLQGGFHVQPASQHSQTDLFSSFKEVMPGDTCVENIKVVNKTEERKPLNLFLTSILPVNDFSDNGLTELLSVLKIKVWNGSDLVFDGDAGTTSNEVIALGTIQYNKNIELRVELSVPVSVDNKQAEYLAKIQWIFNVEDASEPVDPSENEGNPNTSDSSNLAFYGFLLAGSFIALIYGLNKKIKTSV